MKKTLVAVAAFAAVTGAMAEVKISGAVDYAFMKYQTGGVTTNSMGGDTNQFNNIKFSASEDLGNGITAKAVIDLGIGYWGTGTVVEQGGVPVTRESHVGLYGDFGDFALGRQYTPLFLAATIDPVGLPALTIGQEGLNAVFLTGGVRDVRAVGSAAYTSPSISGFKLNYFTSQSGVQQGGVGIGYTTGYGIAYAMGPVSLNYQTQKADVEGIAAFHQDAAAGASAAFTAGTNQTSRAIFAAKYDAGFATLAYIRGTTSNDAFGHATNYVAIGVPIPGTNLSVAASVNRSAADDKANDANDASVNGSIFKVNYAFSKRTNAYFLYGNDETNNVDGADTSRKTTSTSFGLSHSF